jgi:hypothetical protein
MNIDSLMSKAAKKYLEKYIGEDKKWKKHYFYYLL